MNTFNLTGKARFIGLEGGFWAIEGDNGKKYTPINMPEQLKCEGAQVSIRCQLLKGAASLSMWGEAVRIISFETLSII